MSVVAEVGFEVVEALDVVFEEIVMFNVEESQDGEDCSQDEARRGDEPVDAGCAEAKHGECNHDEGQGREKQGDDEVDQALVLEILYHRAVVFANFGAAISLLDFTVDKFFVIFNAVFHNTIITQVAKKGIFW